VTLSLILLFNLRLGGNSIWSAIFQIAHHSEEVILGMSTHSFDAAKKVLEEELQDGASKEAEDYFESTREACSTQLRRARGLVRPGATGLCT
jgi:hypothetical protein